MRFLNFTGKGAYVLHWWRTTTPSMTPATLVLLRICYPLNFAQCTINTGLIAYKVWKRHRSSDRLGLQVAPGSAGVSLMTVAYIIVESAMGYTALNFVLGVMYLVNHRAVTMLQGSMAPFASECLPHSSIETTFDHMAVYPRRLDICPDVPPAGVFEETEIRGQFCLPIRCIQSSLFSLRCGAEKDAFRPAISDGIF